MNCEVCNGTGWKITESGAVRCACITLRERESAGTPLDAAAVSVATKALAVLAFFPVERAAQTVIGDALAAMCPSVEALRYVVRRACAHYTSWDKCGIKGLRQIVCTRFRPADGIEGGPTEQFPDGLPSETKHNPLALPPGASRALPPGHVASADVECEQIVTTLARETHRLPRSPKVEFFAERKRALTFGRMLEQIDTPPHLRTEPPPLQPPTPQFYTQADVDREVKKLHEARETEKEPV